MKELLDMLKEAIEYANRRDWSKHGDPAPIVSHHFQTLLYVTKHAPNLDARLIELRLMGLCKECCDWLYKQAMFVNGVGMMSGTSAKINDSWVFTGKTSRPASLSVAQSMGNAIRNQMVDAVTKGMGFNI